LHTSAQGIIQKPNEMKEYKLRNKANERTKRKKKKFGPCNPVTGTGEKTRVPLI
jgi:hypothetical protein